MATMQLQSLELETPPLPIQPPPSANGIVYGFRTRHLSCIEENDSDSQHGSSMPRGAYDLMQQADETFRKLSLAVEAADEDDDDDDDNDDDADDDDDEHDDIDGHDELDTIPMIDESRLCDADYLDELIATESTLADSGNVEEAEELWQPSFNRNDIMMTSCYGTLNSSFGSDMTTASMAAPAVYGEQLQATPKKAPEKEPLYATPEKRRENNRSFDSTCASQSSSIYGGSMNSSLDLKYMMSVSLGGGGTGGVGTAFNAGNLGNGGISATSTLRGASVPPLDLSLMSSDGISTLDWGSASVTCVLDKGEGNPAEELNEEMAAKCLSAAESGE